MNEAEEMVTITKAEYEVLVDAKAFRDRFRAKEAERLRRYRQRVKAVYLAHKDDAAKAQGAAQ